MKATTKICSKENTSETVCKTLQRSLKEITAN